ncbi:MAG: hypothetical protein PF961_05720 [Planctomycetota bacterium]|jgi:hypothetical protein|nr:hypothetical protein [Planctomycetota bacterium]
MRYRSLSFHESMPDLRAIELGAKLGFNDVCFQTENGTVGPVAALAKRAAASGLFSMIQSLGMQVSVWVHEFADLDPAWGPVAIDNDALWRGLSERYAHMLDAVIPEVDTLVLTVAETDIWVTDDPELLVRLCQTLHAACAARSKRLMLRSFIYHPDECERVAQAIAQLPDEVAIMTKATPQDWHLRSVDHPLLGRVGSKQQVVEFDVTGEYWRGTHLAHAWPGQLTERFASWREHAIDGMSVRVDRGWGPWNGGQHRIVGRTQEASLWALAALLDDKPAETGIRNWARERYGAGSEDALVRIVDHAEAVVAESLCVATETFGDTRNSIPGDRSLIDRSGSVHTQSAYDDDHDSNGRNPFYRNWSSWRWGDQPERSATYQALRRGDPQIIAAKRAALAAASTRADAALSELEACPAITGSDRHILRFQLEENRYHLHAMAHCQLAWLHATQALYAPDTAAQHQAQAEAELQALATLHAAHRDDSCVGLRLGEPIYLKRGTYWEVEKFIAVMREAFSFEK